MTRGGHGGIVVHGSPTGPARRSAVPAWRGRVAAATAGTPPSDGVAVAFTLEPGRWIDLDTVTEETFAGLRDAGVCRRGFAGLDALLATRRDGVPAGVVVHTPGAAALRRQPVPGPTLLDVSGAVLPRPGRRDDKRAWRAALAEGWGRHPPLTGPVWADLELGVAGSLLGPLEPALDALEPVLGRDPRGRDWQEFFPNDHIIRWLRVRRSPTLSAPLRLRLGSASDRRCQAMDSGGAGEPPASPRAQDQG